MVFTAERLLCEHVERSIELAKLGLSKLPEGAMRVPGLIGHRTRHFYNNLCSVRGTRYLEVGGFKGASAVAALAANDATGVTIDNFSEFEGPRGEFLSNTAAWTSGRLELVERDFRAALADLSGAGFDVYLYDGPHEEADQRDAITLGLGAMASPCVVVVDDFGWQHVERGTRAGLLASGWTVEREWTLAGNGWWNGAGVFVMRA